MKQAEEAERCILPKSLWQPNGAQPRDLIAEVDSVRDGVVYYFLMVSGHPTGRLAGLGNFEAVDVFLDGWLPLIEDWNNYGCH